MSTRRLHRILGRTGWLRLGGAAGLLTLAAGIILGARPRGDPPAAPARPPAPAPAGAAGIRFRDEAAALGLDYRWNPTPHRPLRNRDAFGAGCAFLDYDNDGWQDVLLVGSPVCGLFRNIGGTRFQEVTSQLGLDRHRGNWCGVAVGDYNGDGWLDLLLTGYHQLLLLRGDRGRRFTDRTREARLRPGNWDDWGSSAGFMDLDADGDLDLVTLNYVVTGPGAPEYCEIRPGIRSGCPPATYDPEFGRLFRNEGNGTFADATNSSGFLRANGKALVVGFCDADDDGKIDFYVGNDGMPAEFMRNQGGLRFQNIGVDSGTAYGETPGHALAAMGVDWADYDRDGKLDFAVSAFSDESYAIFRNEGNSRFSYAGWDTGIAGVTLKPLGFGTSFLDIDNDTWADLVFANGHVYDRIAELDGAQTFRQPMMVFRNAGGRKFEDLAPHLGPDVNRPLLGRGTAVGDYDNDGRMDLLVVDFEGSPVLLHNLSETPHHWLTLDLRSRTGNRFAYGASVLARAGSEVWIGQVSPASSYLSSRDRRIHFGLGRHTALDSVTVRWPSGARETIVSPEADRVLVITEGEGAAPVGGS